MYVQHDLTKGFDVSKKSLTKDDLRGPDPFRRLMYFIWKSIQAYKQLVWLFLALIFIAPISWTAWSIYQDHRETQAQDDYFLVEKALLEKQKDFAEAKFQDKDQKDKQKDDQKTDQKKNLATGDLEKDFGEQIKAFKAVAVEHHGTVAAQLAAINIIALYNEYESSKKALDLVPLFKKQKRGKGLFDALLTVQIGNLLAGANDCKGALSEWEKVLNNPQWEYAYSQVRLRMGTCYESLKQKDKAKQFFELVKKEEASTPVGRLADRYLRTL